MAPQDLLERGDLKGCKEGMENQDLKAQVVQVGKMDFQVIQVKEESQAFKEKRGPQGHQVWLDHKVNQVNLAQQETEVTQGLQVCLESMVYPELQGKRVGREILVYLGHLERVVQLD